MNESNIKNINFHSDILDKDMGINVYLPKEYEEKVIHYQYYIFFMEEVETKILYSI